MQARLAEELANEKQRLAQLLDTKLADAVASFLVETLGKEVDLGAQAAYLTSMLEAHKDELIKGVTDEA
jgi:phenylpyruvate tautomerase PptA (4-oxalocrotonate tautomerase family)